MEMEQIRKLVEIYHHVGVFGLGVFLVFLGVDILLFTRLDIKDILTVLRHRRGRRKKFFGGGRS